MEKIAGRVHKRMIDILLRSAIPDVGNSADQTLSRSYMGRAVLDIRSWCMATILFPLLDVVKLASLRGRLCSNITKRVANRYSRHMIYHSCNAARNNLAFSFYKSFRDFLQSEAIWVINWFGCENNIEVLKLTMKLYRPVNPSSNIATHFSGTINIKLINVRYLVLNIYFLIKRQLTINVHNII